MTARELRDTALKDGILTGLFDAQALRLEKTDDQATAIKLAIEKSLALWELRITRAPRKNR